ncbi:hydroxymethylbilane synthase [Nakamurella multipartita]|uniref:Porphobilinogen deaminase n=1 Tax=Nakamurella multipartita (strain ATCC 700099 / DSM 44233 / CIP 104796 / JCM 9543 / NBRC 105858 / Y-104) TaxID=479431 RepID=C8XF53_NAKMY|nr:hydroxymethylbilane synthase [Nakamurella multipartita]ACV77939.1 porphobilinogen deaminase [Nakamurella multipartita DSM 44233]
MSSRVLRVGTRGSALALAQSGMIADRVARLAGATVELVRIRTEGDVNTGPLATIGGTGVFVTGVREALLDGRADIVVHSYKDLPTAPTEGITVAAVPERESPFDALCARDGLRLDDLPRGSTVGTGSPRRAAQLLARRPDLAVVPIRGNVDTRLRQVSEGHLDAVVLAAAGLNRLGRADAITDVLDADRMLPAPAQGALAVECRSGADTWFTEATRTLDDAPTRAAVVAERVLLRDLEAGCSAPVGAFAQVQGDALTLRAVVVAVDGSSEFRVHRAGSPAAAADLGARAAADLIGQGAAGLLGAR